MIQDSGKARQQWALGVVVRSPGNVMMIPGRGVQGYGLYSQVTLEGWIALLQFGAFFLVRSLQVLQVASYLMQLSDILLQGAC